MERPRHAWPIGLVLAFVGCGASANQSATTDSLVVASVDASAEGDGRWSAPSPDAPRASVDVAEAPPRGDFTIGVPAMPDVWTTAPGQDAAPAIVYPSAETRFPRNIYRTLFQWKTNGATAFRLFFDGPGTRVTVFTDGKHPLCAESAGVGCWEADEQAWRLIADGNAGRTVSFLVDGFVAGGTPPVRRSAAIVIGFSAEPVPGAIFYWSTTSAGIRRANVGAAEPEDYLTGKPGTVYAEPRDTVRCVACHVVSRDGKYLAAPVDAASGKSLWIAEVTRAAPPKPIVKSVAGTEGHGFATISPDNAEVMVAWGGRMWLIDRITGTKTADVSLGAMLGTHPDWSPLGDSVVFATGKGDAPSAAGLAVVRRTGPVWSAPTILVEGVAGKPKPGAPGPSSLFPMHSPDGRWIAFSRGKGGHGDLTAQLWVVPAAGGDAVELVRANRIVSNALTDGQSENNQPTWAPPGDLWWIAFNSKRPYGVVSSGGTQQIWVAAIDPKKLGTGQDPSYPAFRLQFQGLKEDNHRAFWTLDVRESNPDRPPPAPVPDAGMCVATDQPCDPVADVCCDANMRCLTIDDGRTYTCQMQVL